MENANQASRDGRFPGFGARTRCFIWLAVVLGGTHVLFAQHRQGSTTPQEKSKSAGQDAEPRPSDNKNENWRAEPGCFAQAPGFAGRAPVSRTWVLMSPDGRYGAYAVNEAVATRSADGEISGCKSTSRLFVTGPGREKAEAVLVMEPSEGASGNSIELIDWSPEGHRLLVMQGFWAWASDAGGVEARIYDADSGKLSSEDGFREAFQRHAGRDCVITYLPMGFSGAGKVVVSARPDVDEEGIVQKDSCVMKEGSWMVDPVGFGIRRVRDDFKVRKYGKKRPANTDRKSPPQTPQGWATPGSWRG
jgi:hypothetical protein